MLTPISFTFGCYLAFKLFTGERRLVTRGEQNHIPTDREKFTLKDLKSLPELNPPDVMPNGNVGTPTMVFMDFIKQCRLPPSIIKKLGLSFPRVRTTKMYGNVQFDYGGNVEHDGTKSDESDIQVCTGDGHELVLEKNDFEENVDKDENHRFEKSLKDSEHNSRKNERKKGVDKDMKQRMDLNIEEKMIHHDAESDGVSINPLPDDKF